MKTMVNLKEIKMIKKGPANIVMSDNSIGFIDMTVNIEYRVAVRSEKIKVNEEVSELEYVFDSCMFLKMPASSYQNIENIYCKELEYTIRESKLPEVGIKDYEILRNENKKALKLIKEYLRTEEFKRILLKQM